jgi:hypothetical protein
MLRIKPGISSSVPSDARGRRYERMYRTRFQVSAEKAVASSNVGVLAAKPLTALAQQIITGLSNPAVPRNLIIKGSAAGTTGNVVAHGTNFDGKVITETIALNGVTAVEGNKAFKTVSQIDLPIQTHTPVPQVETATATGATTGAGNASIVVTAAGMNGSPKTIPVAVGASDSPTVWAGKVRTALAADADVSAFFTVGGSTTSIQLTAITPAATDATMNIAISTGTATGITAAPTSADTTPAVATDTVSVGWGDKLGLPYKLPFNTMDKTFFNGVLEVTAPTVITSAIDLESNTIHLSSALNGSVIDVLLDV